MSLAACLGVLGIPDAPRAQNSSRSMKNRPGVKSKRPPVFSAFHRKSREEVCGEYTNFQMQLNVRAMY